MVKIVEITQSSDNITCDDSGQAKIQFNVNSLSTSPIRIGAKVVPEGNAQASWFSLEGKSEKTLNANATDQFTINVNAKEAAEGKYKLRLLVYNVDNSDEDYAESQTIALNVSSKIVPPPPPPPSSKWWIWLLVGLIIVSLLGVIAFLALKDNGSGEPQTMAIIPNVIDKPFDEAKSMLEQLEFNSIDTETQFNASKPKNTVLEQTPDANTKADPSSTTIKLVLADSTTEMPDLKDLVQQGARERLRKKGFKKIKIETKFDQSKPAGTVLDQTPAAGENVSTADTEVTLIVADAGVKVPNVKNKLLKDALFTLQRANLSLGALSTKTNANLAEETVIEQNPQSGNVPEKTEVNLVVSTKKRNFKLMKPVLMQRINESRITFSNRIRRELAPADDSENQ